MHEDVLLEPLRWRKPRVVFVDSMADLAHAKVSRAFLVRVWAVMAATPQHTYQILTKRPERLRAILTDQGCGCPHPHEPGRHFSGDVAAEAARLGGGAALERAGVWPLPNVWLGTSIESDGYARRAAVLRQVPAALRFLSLEPLLGPLPSLDLAGIDWVIVGGESGPGHRPLDLDWVRDLRDRCSRRGIAFFFKQWGGRTPKAGGRLLEGRTWDELPRRTVTAPAGTS